MSKKFDFKLMPLLTLKSGEKEYLLSRTLAAVFLVEFGLFDFFLCVYNNLFYDAAAIAAIFGLQVFALLRLPAKSNQYLNSPNIFFAVLAAVLALVSLNGQLTGACCYYFSAALVYFTGTINSPDKKYDNFIYITVLFIAGLLVQYFFMPAHTGRFLNGLMAYRFFSSVALSAILARHLFILQVKYQQADKRNDFNEVLFQSHEDAYIIFDNQTKEVVDYNRSMLALFQLPAATDLKQLYITQVMMRYLAEDSANKQLMMNGIPDNWQGEAGFINHAKNSFDALVKSVVYQQGDKKLQLLSIRNTSAGKATAVELQNYKERLLAADNTKTRFLSSMSHELRTPLNGIIGTANLIKAEAALPEAAKKNTALLLQSAEHMLDMINDILDFSKIGADTAAPCKQAFNISNCINKIVAQFNTKFSDKNLRLLTDQSEELENLPVLGDEKKLSQVIANLLSNALKFTLEGSATLIVKANAVTSNKINVRFEVADTGIGIAKNKQADIFTGFAQVHAAGLSRRYDGTGLGLTISEKLVSLLGGKLQVESETGKGSSFYFNLDFEPALTTTVASPAPTTEKPAGDIRGIKILVVEDNEINATILKTFLKKWEVQVKEAGNGIHALEMVKYHRFDLILMDLEMPEMDGFTAVKIIRQTDTTTPILAFTASMLENMDTTLAEAGFNGYVLKPYRPTDLKAKIELFAPYRKIDYA